MTIFLKGVQLVYWAKFMPTLSHYRNIIETKYTKKTKTKF